MARKPKPVLKAFVLCEDIRERPDNTMDLIAAGLSAIRSSSQPPFPLTHTFWIYLQLTDAKPRGKVRLALMRADSGRRYFFREMIVEHPERIKPTSLAVRVLDCIFPERGVYYVELFYDNEWLIDQRLEIDG